MPKPRRQIIHACQFVVLVIFATLLLAQVQDSTAPARAKGISMHMLPKGVADLGGERWGLHVDYAAYLKPESSQPVIQTTEEFLSYVHKQDAAVQKNGVWIVVTNPDAYSATEKALLDDIKSLSAREKIVLFVCRASELPNGWKRYGD